MCVREREIEGVNMCERGRCDSLSDSLLEMTSCSLFPVSGAKSCVKGRCLPRTQLVQI